MLEYQNVREVHIELSSECNASCPLCPRNYFGYPHNGGYPEHSMTLDEAKQLFQPEFIAQLDKLLVNGNYGDFVMNPHSIDILRYFREHNPDLLITVSTNGAARSAEFWTALANMNCDVYFCIDGLEDTHSMYRMNTLYSTVIRNALTFINAAGGRASWKFIVFDHNRHQIDEARRRSEELGFDAFYLSDTGRDIGWAFDKRGQLLHTIGAVEPVTFNKIWPLKSFANIEKELGAHQHYRKDTICCETKERRTIYVNSIGEVYPCCYMGFSPRTYGLGRIQEITNSQIQPLMQPNNALQLGIEQSMQWFDNIPAGWQPDRFDQGRLLVCDMHCGKNL